MNFLLTRSGKLMWLRKASAWLCTTLVRTIFFGAQLSVKMNKNIGLILCRKIKSLNNKEKNYWHVRC